MFWKRGDGRQLMGADMGPKEKWEPPSSEAIQAPEEGLRNP